MLAETFNRHQSDKAQKHAYHLAYEPDFAPDRETPLRLLEVGILRGESLAAWLDYFPNATIYGLDVFTRVPADQVPILRHPRVHWLRGDSTAPSLPAQLNQAWPGVRFDIIIDDGLHTPRANALTFQNLFPFLQPQGAYYVEDVWPLDIMSEVEYAHPWIAQQPAAYNASEMNFFLAQLQGLRTQRYDLRSRSGQGDSYIIRVQR